MPDIDGLLEQPEENTQDAWTQFLEAESREDYFLGWLTLQCGFVPSVRHAVLVARQDEEAYRPVATWPDRGAQPARLAEVIERAMDEQCGLVLALEDAPHCFGIAYPLVVEGRLLAVVAMEVEAAGEGALREAMARLQWGIAWLEVFYRRRRADEDGAALSRLKAAVDLLSVTLGEENFHDAAAAFVTALAAAADCDRVSAGFVRGGVITLEAISNSAEIGKKMNLTGAIVAAMDESILQRQETMYPAPDTADLLINRNHEILSRMQNQAAIASFPLHRQDRYYGVILCERPADRPFSDRDREFIRAATALAAPALEAKELIDRPLLRTILDAAKRQADTLTGPGYPARKLCLVGLAFVFLFLCVAKGEYRLSADVSLEGQVKRAIVAPFDGYIDQAPARGGDKVSAGALLCSLDNRDLRLERLSHISQKNQLQRQHQNAVAQYDRAQAAIIEAQLDQATAEFELIDTKLKRTQLLAPFEGVLVAGDLSQRLGSAVSKGEVLFEITPLDAYRVILEVDESRIRDVQVGQAGSLRLSSQPGKNYGFTVSKITPIATPLSGRTFFRVEANLETVDDTLRPGMEGVGKISIDHRRLAGIWTRSLMDWIRLWTWRWLP